MYCIARAPLTPMGVAVSTLADRDVRRYPGSRANPDVSRDALATWLPDLGIGYRWEERLGGRRRVDEDSLDAGSLLQSGSPAADSLARTILQRRDEPLSPA